ncbi:hypothetical protein acsn021_13700 [Anaerocolumna cellulosilytica]|uniref:Site-specific DNA-methyltransferase (adenine-specific) n=1 Tax=Anaerocolumna cellulosilytica TaxID=433286 RepID=A0A6S6R3V7_9FIRM|nr:Dam family site-specific DNA-(adenine-N6)-methyltransferase [Anaerocolumna cellulosilytica]MBB5195557.1 adenine-specific DNA-methyltransferase [Anaerocolumna cellulosilytica]BCJ93801.1 hypothetical protein acsn021_13700 [Anaerocolumna cellulosilytica]
MKTTKQIESTYNITRQTLDNWMRDNLISKPIKDYKGWYQWDETNEGQIQFFIESKKENKHKLAEQLETLKITNRRYLGSKQKMLDFIWKVISENTSGVNTVADVFGGTGSVAEMFRQKGKNIIVNDILYSNYLSFLTWFGTEKVNYKKIKQILSELNKLEPTKENYVSEHFGDKYFTLENAKKIGEIRERIENYKDINEREKAFLLTSLLYAMDKVANTVGHYDAYRQKMDSTMPLRLRLPELNENKKNEVYNSDANRLVRGIIADLVYIDTPYNSRQYGDAYHLLENIMEWKKPEVIGKAMKMVDRSKVKSDYCTVKAPQAFEDLIQGIDSKYILVSYNNMAEKGAGRSNAKISNEEIIETLKKKGKVIIFETDFNVYTTGKTKIENHKELLYLCEVKKKTNKNYYVQSALNYTGGKYKLLPQIEPLFPKEYNNFIDLFAGGANVGVNAKPKEKIYINEIKYYLVELYKFFKSIDIDILLCKIETLIDEYGLSNTKQYGYAHYNSDSGKGVGEYNKEPFKKLKTDYNNGKFTGDDKNLVFYILIVFGFNNQIRFNSKGEYNLPQGKRDFNDKMVTKLKTFHKAIKDNKIEFSNLDFREFRNYSKDDFIYVDPPYRISTASYNELGGWTLQDDLDLLEYLDKANKKGVKFALSNVIEHKGEENNVLIEWAKKYNIHELNFNYNNSNYQSKAKGNVTKEVLITNY